jgi:hypothetical protein
MAEGDDNWGLIFGIMSGMILLSSLPLIKQVFRETKEIFTLRRI